MSKIVAAVSAILLFAGAAAAAPASSVEVQNAWARATPGGAQTGATYLTLEAPAGDTLTGASSPVAQKVELHQMSMTGNVMKMRQLSSIPLPPGQKVTLQPGRMHMMLLGLKAPLRPGQSFPLTLDFAKAGERQVSVKVEPVGAMGPGMHQAGGMSMPMPMPMHH